MPETHVDYALQQLAIYCLSLPLFLNELQYAFSNLVLDRIEHNCLEFLHPCRPRKRGEGAKKSFDQSQEEDGKCAGGKAEL